MDTQKTTLLAHYTTLCRGDDKKALVMRNAKVRYLASLVEGDITPDEQKELQEYCSEFEEVHRLVEFEINQRHGGNDGNELKAKLHYALTIPPEDEQPVSETPLPELHLVDNSSELVDAHEVLTSAMEDVQTLAGDQLAWLGQQTEALATVQSQVIALSAMMQQINHGMKPKAEVLEGVGETDKVAYNALVLVVGKLLPNTLLKTINQQRAVNQHVARKLIKASVQAGGDRKEKVLELFHGDIPDMTNW